VQGRANGPLTSDEESVRLIGNMQNFNTNAYAFLEENGSVTLNQNSIFAKIKNLLGMNSLSNNEREKL